MAEPSRVGRRFAKPEGPCLRQQRRTRHRPREKDASRTRAHGRHVFFDIFFSARFCPAADYVRTRLCRRRYIPHAACGHSRLCAFHVLRKPPGTLSRLGLTRMLPETVDRFVRHRYTFGHAPRSVDHDGAAKIVTRRPSAAPISCRSAVAASVARSPAHHSRTSWMLSSGSRLFCVRMVRAAAIL